MIPNVLRTWAPRGKTPILRHRYRREKVSVISGVSVSPRRQRLGLYAQIHVSNIGQLEVCEFLRHLLRHLRGPVIALLDNSRTHRGEPLRILKQRHPRLQVEYFPAYAPELNPDEGVWSLAKRKLANGRPDNIEELVEQVGSSLRSIRGSQASLRGCIKRSGLSLFLR